MDRTTAMSTPVIIGLTFNRWQETAPVSNGMLCVCVCGRCRRTKLFSRKKVNKLVVEDIFCPLVVRNQFETKRGTSQTLKTCQLPAEQGMGNLALYSLLLLHNPPLLGKRFLLCTENILLCMMFICYAPNLLFKH